jgi:ribosomal protein L40E
MAFFEKLGDLARNIGDKTGDAIETGKLNSKIKAEKTAIAECMRKIGEYYYGKYKEGEEADPAVSEIYAAIDGHNGTIEETQAEIARIQAENTAATQPVPAPAASAVPAAPAAAGIVCQSCGASNPVGTKFCSECGAKIEIPAPPQEKFCPDCGAKLPAESKFCGECGHRFEV